MRNIFILVLIMLTNTALAGPEWWQKEWPNTDFEKSSVPFVEILSGGPPKDGIPAINDPRFHTIAEEKQLTAKEPIVSVVLNGTARAYPIRYLMWHEIVNDRIDNIPVTITFCPLCNAALVFDGRLNGTEYTFGVSGKLRHSDMIMYDHQTESWWQQFLGQAVVGQMLDAKLKPIPSLLQSWDAYKAEFPNGMVMTQPDDISRSYGDNPYAGYDSSGWPFLYSGDAPPHNIDPLARVVRVENRAWPLERLRKNAEIIEAGVKLTWQSGQNSALDTRDISQGKDVGNIRVSDTKGNIIPHEVVFAFAFQAFLPDGTWMIGE